jgi:hypothetical protein
MKPVDCSQLRVHVCVCVNERPEAQACCSAAGGDLVFRWLKERVAREGLVRTHWVTRTRCLGFCTTVGATVAIHRPGLESRWLNEVGTEDLDSLWKEIAG